MIPKLNSIFQEHYCTNNIEDIDPNQLEKMPASSKRPNMELPAHPVITMAIDATGTAAAVVNVVGMIGWAEEEALSFRGRVEELIQNGASKIVVRINSLGGSVWDALAMYDILLACGVPVETEVCGCAASAASLLLMAGTRRAINPNGRIMIHPARAGIYGTIDEIKEFVHVLEEDQKRVWSIYAEKCGKSMEDTITTHSTDTWYTAEEAMAYGLVTEIVTDGKDTDVSEGAAESETKAGPDDGEAAVTMPTPAEDDEDTDTLQHPAALEEGDDENEDTLPAPPRSGMTATLARLNKLGAAVGIKVFRAAAREAARVDAHQKVRAITDRLKIENQGLLMQVARLERENRALSANLPQAVAAAAVRAQALQGVNVADLPMASSAPEARLIDVPTTRAEWNTLTPAEKMSICAQMPDILTQLK